jgi:hypothetical protein
LAFLPVPSSAQSFLPCYKPWFEITPRSGLYTLVLPLLR